MSYHAAIDGFCGSVIKRKSDEVGDGWTLGVVAGCVAAIFRLATHVVFFSIEVPPDQDVALIALSLRAPIEDHVLGVTVSILRVGRIGHSQRALPPCHFL